MSKWNFDIGKTSNITENFDSKPMIEKIKSIRKKKPIFENPKSIELLESIFDPFAVTEGFDIGEKIKDNKFTKGLSGTGQEILAGIEGTKDSLENAFNKISDITKLNKLKNGEDSINELKSQYSKVKDALTDSKNFIIPDSNVAQIQNFKMGSTGITDNNIFQSGKRGLDDIVGNAKGSGFFSNLSGEGVTIKGKLDALQGDIDNQKIKKTEGISASDLSTPGGSQGTNTSTIKVVGLGDQLKKKMKEAVEQIKNILNFIMKNLAKQMKYAAEKLKEFFVKFRDNFNYVMITIANALTHNNASVDEIRVFSSETMKFTTVLFTYVFLYNWYFLMFHNEDPEFRYTINVKEQVFDRSRVLYAFFGPSLRAVEMVDWILLEKIPMIKNYITSKPILFFLLAIAFFVLVLGNFQMSMLTSFLKALTFSPDQTILSILTSIIVLGYGLKFICYDAGILGAIGGSGSGIIIILGGLMFLLLFIFYVLFIASFAGPLGVLLVNTYIVVYSFLAILIYKGSGAFTTINEIFKDVSGLSTGEEEEGQDGESPGVITRIGNFITKYVKFINMFLVELLIIMILLFGINTYTSQYGSITFDKTTSINKNSISAPVNSAFTRLFTWLIIFNTLLIVFVIVRMVSKYYKLTDRSQQPEGEEGEEETAPQ
jgi:molecular chaperone GrpE (heat shock protein)